MCSGSNWGRTPSDAMSTGLAFALPDIPHGLIQGAVLAGIRIGADAVHDAGNGLIGLRIGIVPRAVCWVKSWGHILTINN